MTVTHVHSTQKFKSAESILQIVKALSSFWYQRAVPDNKLKTSEKIDYEHSLFYLKIYKEERKKKTMFTVTLAHSFCSALPQQMLT